MNADELTVVIDTIAGAPFRADGWTDVLTAMGRISGGWGGQLIAQARDRLEFASVVTLPREAFEDYVKHGSNDIARAPRLRAALAGPLMRSLCDEDYITDATRSRWPVYRDLYEPYDAHSCATARVADHRDLSLSLVLFHTRGQGPYQRAQLDTIDRLLPHLRRAFEVRLAIEAEAVHLALGALGSLGHAALVCDPRGRLIEASPAGEALLRAQEFLAVRNGTVRAAAARCADPFDRAMRRPPRRRHWPPPPPARFCCGTARARRAAWPRSPRFRRTWSGT